MLPGKLNWLTCPEVTSFYSSKDTFKCIGNPSITLSSAQVNDNSCDCPDGSDEPGTAACAFLDPLSPPQPLPGSLSGSTNTSTALPGFYCANAGHIGAYVPFMYVNDGVCDYDYCCDGSEEYAGVGGVKCEDRCAEIGKEYRRIEEEKKKSMARAVRRRKILVKEAASARRKIETKIVIVQDEVRNLEAKRDELQRRYEEIQEQEKGKVYKTEGEGGGKIGVLRGVAKKRVDELRDTLDKVLDQRDEVKEKLEELEGILKKFREEYNPNFNDEGVKAAVKSWEDYAAKEANARAPDIEDKDILDVLKEDSETNGVNWAEFEDEEVTDTDIRELMFEFVSCVVSVGHHR